MQRGVSISSRRCIRLWSRLARLSAATHSKFSYRYRRRRRLRAEATLPNIMIHLSNTYYYIYIYVRAQKHYVARILSREPRIKFNIKRRYSTPLVRKERVELAVLFSSLITKLLSPRKLGAGVHHEINNAALDNRARACFINLSFAVYYARPRAKSRKKKRIARDGAKRRKHAAAENLALSQLPYN